LSSTETAAVRIAQGCATLEPSRRAPTPPRQHRGRRRHHRRMTPRQDPKKSGPEWHKPSLPGVDKTWTPTMKTTRSYTSSGPRPANWTTTRHRHRGTGVGSPGGHRASVTTCPATTSAAAAITGDPADSQPVARALVLVTGPVGDRGSVVPEGVSGAGDDHASGHAREIRGGSDAAPGRPAPGGRLDGRAAGAADTQATGGAVTPTGTAGRIGSAGPVDVGAVFDA
jgi:hypothetical protein